MDEFCLDVAYVVVIIVFAALRCQICIHTHTNSDDPFDINAFGQTITELFDAHILQTVNPPSAQMHQPQYMHYVYCHQQRSESVCACIELSALCLSTVNAVKFIAHKLLP